MSQSRRSSAGTPLVPVPTQSQKQSDPTHKLVDQLVTSIRRRQIVGSLNVGIATAVLVHAVIRAGRYSSVEDLIGQIKRIGRKLTTANPKELATANIIRRTLKLIREEYRAAAAAHLSGPPSAPETPYLGPSTPGLHAPATHYLSNDLAFSSPLGSGSGPTSSSTSPQPSRPSLPHTQTSLSNFVAMRHSRAQSQLERTGSLLDRSSPGSASGVGVSFANGLGMTDMPNSSASPPPSRGGSGRGTARSAFSPGVSMDLSASAASIFAPMPTPGLGAEEFARQSARLKPVLLQAIEEVIGELETTHEDVAKGAKEHIHSSEVILTLGYSKTVEAFLKQAFKDRKFQVIVAESAPSNLGSALAASLSSAGIPTLLIPDSSIHAMIPRITKLVLGCHSVLANGGLFALSGSLSAVLAAHSHAKPVVVPTGQYKFAPVWNLYHEHGAVDYQSPSSVLGVVRGAGRNAESERPGPLQAVEWGKDVEVEAGYWDYVRPELVDLYVTNEGDHSPSYIYRLIKEAYDDEDQQL